MIFEILILLFACVIIAFLCLVYLDPDLQAKASSLFKRKPKKKKEVYTTRKVPSGDYSKMIIIEKDGEYVGRALIYVENEKDIYKLDRFENSIQLLMKD